MASISVTPPLRRRGCSTAAIPGSRFTSAAKWFACAGVASWSTSWTGLSRNGGKSARITSSTWRAVALSGSTWASTEVNLSERNGIPSAIRKAALSVAIGIGRLMTNRESRYQKPLRAGAASRSARRCRKRGASALTRGPRMLRMAGRITSATPAANSATSEPPIPIEYRNRCGKTISDASAAATVSEENRTVRPAVRMVARSASQRSVRPPAPSESTPRLASSSR